MPPAVGRLKKQTMLAYFAMAKCLDVLRLCHAMTVADLVSRNGHRMAQFDREAHAVDCFIQHTWRKATSIDVGDFGLDSSTRPATKRQRHFTTDARSPQPIAKVVRKLWKQVSGSFASHVARNRLNHCENPFEWYPVEPTLSSGNSLSSN